MKAKLWLVAMLLGACAQTAWADCPFIPSSVRFTLNGAETPDKRTGKELSTAESVDVFRTDAHGVLLVREP